MIRQQLRSVGKDGLVNKWFGQLEVTRRANRKNSICISHPVSDEFKIDQRISAKVTPQNAFRIHQRIPKEKERYTGVTKPLCDSKSGSHTIREIQPNF